MTRSLAGLAAVLLLAPAATAQTTCPEGRPVTGDLGIDRYLCIGGACEIWVGSAEGPTHRFTTEPRVDRLRVDGPAIDRLERGDVLVAIDDLLVTTPAAGRRLASLEPGRPVRLWIRRGGRELRVEIVPEPGCGPSGLSVRIPGL